VFREEGLTIADLAQRLGVQEYRVRQFINAQLGFRNFNAFLHQYRLREAQIRAAGRSASASSPLERSRPKGPEPAS
jgi:AraC-like DNA-binding protein